MSVLEDFSVMLLVVAALVKRLGGEVKLTQADIDEVSHRNLSEMFKDNELTFVLHERTSEMTQ